jgi:hypothetical protein
MSAVIKAKGFDPELVTFDMPKHVISNNYIIPIKYDQCHLHVQLPRCIVCTSVYESHGKFYMDVMAPQNSVLMCFTKSMSNCIKQHMLSLARYNLQNTIFKDHILRLTKGADNELFFSIRLKIPRQGQNFQATTTDSVGNNKLITDIKTGSSVLCIVSIDSCYSMQGSSGFNLNVTNVRIMNDSSSHN